MAKFERHAIILKLIEENVIRTQDELADALRSKGFDITQATVSRDIRELRLIKVLMPDGSYRYSSMEYNEKGMEERLKLIFAETVISIDSVANFIVLKTIASGAQTVALAVDSLDSTDIMGCVGGDDTVLVIVRSTEAVEKLLCVFKGMLTANH